ncbi:hypothetical protein BJX96DRAFT_180546 [Aspergillus floccosus]
MAAVATQPQFDAPKGDDIMDLFRQSALAQGDVSDLELQNAFNQLSSEPGGFAALTARLACEREAAPQCWKQRDVLSGRIELSPVHANFTVDNKTAALRIDGEAAGYFRPQSTQIYGNLYYNDLRKLYGRKKARIFTVGEKRLRFVVNIYDDGGLLARYEVVDPPFTVDATPATVNITRP